MFFMVVRKNAGIREFLQRKLALAILVLTAPLPKLSRSVSHHSADSRELGRRESATDGRNSFAKTRFSNFVGVSSAEKPQKVGLLITFLGVSDFLRCAHNPEVGGSSPSSATIKTTVFTSKTVVFLTFRKILF